jgi:replicative DNA helicase
VSRDSTQGYTVGEIKSLLALTGAEAIIVDGVNLMRGQGESVRVRLQNITRDLKQVALETGTVIFILAQLNREAAKDAVPSLSNLKESGSLEEDSDIVILLSTVWDENDLRKIQNIPPYMLEMPCTGEEFRDIRRARNSLVIGQVAKNRDGEIGMTQLEFIASRFGFRELKRKKEDLPF